MRIDWASVGAIVKRVVDDIEQEAGDHFDGLVRIGIDETSYKKGHKYMTVVVNHDTGALIWASPGHGKGVLSEFFNALTEEQCQSILHVSADGARWIAECVAKYCPNAERCVDPFHVVSWATEALDEVRKGVWRDARAETADEGNRRKPGRPKKGEEKKASAAKTAKGFRYALLKNPENRTASQEATVEMIAKTNPKLYRAYLLKEGLRTVFRLGRDEAAAALAAWIKWAQHCRLPEFVELQRKIRRHKDAILASIEQGLSNARVEAMNNKIKLTIRMSYGFRNLNNMIAMVMLRCAKLDVLLPGRAG
jgi:transposase